MIFKVRVKSQFFFFAHSWILKKNPSYFPCYLTDLTCSSAGVRHPRRTSPVVKPRALCVFHSMFLMDTQLTPPDCLCPSWTYGRYRCVSGHKLGGKKRGKLATNVKKNLECFVKNSEISHVVYSIVCKQLSFFEAFKKCYRECADRLLASATQYLKQKRIHTKTHE